MPSAEGMYDLPPGIGPCAMPPLKDGWELELLLVDRMHHSCCNTISTILSRRYLHMLTSTQVGTLFDAFEEFMCHAVDVRGLVRGWVVLTMRGFQFLRVFSH